MFHRLRVLAFSQMLNKMRWQKFHVLRSAWHIILAFQMKGILEKENTDSTNKIPPFKTQSMVFKKCWNKLYVGHPSRAVWTFWSLTNGLFSHSFQSVSWSAESLEVFVIFQKLEAPLHWRAKSWSLSCYRPT